MQNATRIKQMYDWINQVNKDDLHYIMSLKTFIQKRKKKKKSYIYFFMIFLGE